MAAACGMWMSKAQIILGVVCFVACFSLFSSTNLTKQNLVSLSSFQQQTVAVAVVSENVENLSKESISHTNTQENATRDDTNDSANDHKYFVSKRGVRYSLDDGVERGFLSEKPAAFFESFQNQVDDPSNNRIRCQQYRMSYTARNPANRKIYYGALIANEPWELLEIIAAETYGIFAGMVFVESNRTQNASPRDFKRLDQAETFKKLFGVQNVLVRPYINEDPNLQGLEREHTTRAEIFRGWKELGMQPQDVGYLVDADETFTRDMLRAIQVCDIPELDDTVDCHHTRTGIRATTQSYESSPECAAQGREGWHPDVFPGTCLEEIGDEAVHPRAPRKPGSVMRAPGWGGGGWEIHDNLTSNYPLYSAGDVRRHGAARGIKLNFRRKKYKGLSQFTAFHLHNFFTNAHAIKHKYRTYGHSIEGAYQLRLQDLHEDLTLMTRCVRNESDIDDKMRYHRVPGGFDRLKPHRPIYFEDDDYRRQRHEFMRQMVVADDEAFAAASTNLTKERI